MEKFIFFFSSSGMWNTAFEGRKRRKENEWERRGGDEGKVMGGEGKGRDEGSGLGGEEGRRLGKGVADCAVKQSRITRRSICKCF